MYYIYRAFEDNGISHSKELDENPRYIKTYSKDSVHMPNKSVDLSKNERMKKNHKWIARKKNSAGKWIYDYGKGFPGEAKKVVKSVKKIGSKLLDRAHSTGVRFLTKMHR